MELLLFLLKGILIGLLFGIPVGEAGTMTASRTLNYGFRAEMITGLGSFAADCIYAAVGAFGLTLVLDFLMKYETVIHLLGGFLVIAMGICEILKKTTNDFEKKPIKRKWLMFLSAFEVSITNSAALLFFLFALSYFNLVVVINAVNGVLLVFGVLVGTFLWWLILSVISSRFRKKSTNGIIRRHWAFIIKQI